MTTTIIFIHVCVATGVMSYVLHNFISDKLTCANSFVREGSYYHAASAGPYTLVYTCSPWFSV